MNNLIDLNSIGFTESSDPKNQGLGRKIGRYWVSKAVFERAQKLVNDAFATLTWDKPQTVRSICFHPDWASWSWGLRINLGRSLKYFVDQGMLPLTIVNQGKKGPRRYMHK